VDSISAGEFAPEALSFSTQRPNLAPDEKRKVVETITERIVVGRGEVSDNVLS
jgi:hypothetical protein